uniref:Uncharacterized protein n=1 Tax=Panagrolaimus sp. PS1159 TaxID=55785 RepID=A0AC35EW40_9BILA
MKSAIILVVTLFVATLAQDVAVATPQDQPQVDFKAELNKLNDQFSSKFAQFQQQVATGLEKMKSENVPEDFKAKVESMKTDLGKTAAEIKTTYADDFKRIGDSFKTFADKVKTNVAAKQPEIQAAVADAKAKAPGFFDNVKSKFANWFDNQA